MANNRGLEWPAEVRDREPNALVDEQGKIGLRDRDARLGAVRFPGAMGRG